MLILCDTRQNLIVEYLNAVAEKHRVENDEARAFSQIEVEVAAAYTRQAQRVTENCRLRLLQHCRDHKCCRMFELDEIATEQGIERRSQTGYRRA
jgi:hypothetical protein